MDISEDVVYRLREIRETRGLTRRELAENALIGQYTIAAYERAKGGVVSSAESALRLCCVLDVAPEQICEIHGSCYEKMQRLAKVYRLEEWLTSKRVTFYRGHSGGFEARRKSWLETLSPFGMHPVDVEQWAYERARNPRSVPNPIEPPY